MIESLIKYQFLQNAFLTGIMIGLIAPVLGVFIVVRRLSLIADALSHVTLSGIAASLLIEKKFPETINLNPVYFGMLFSFLGAIFIEKLRAVYKHYQELAIPIMLSGGVGLGVIFISLADGFNNDLFNYLFGSVNAVTRTDMWSILIIMLIVISIIFICYKELVILSFDEEYATVSGVNKRWIHQLFIIMVAIVIASSMRIVGILLVSSLMTLPVASAMKFAKSFKQAIFFSILIGEASVILGLFSAYHLDIAPGGTIVMVSIVILLCSISYNKFIKRYQTRTLNMK
ncbi:metal ABC transporter permease [Alkalihalobacillus deserti]|uniref:metal ABC transporter permease n=1 Tax=Alkalihalobacillus deserti TaxID=2879466 RepID=UPI001D154CE2|nr:metal ABC transporter permease [Alkalihalobacillus deserti]